MNNIIALKQLEKERTNLINLGKQFLTINGKAKPKILHRNTVLFLLIFFFLWGYELTILKLLYVYTVIEQIRKYIVDNENHVSPCQRKKLQIIKRSYK